MDIEIRNKSGHVEVYNRYGEFLFSADTVAEAYREIEADMMEIMKNKDTDSTAA